MSDIIGHGGKSGGSSHVHYEANDSLRSISYARVLDLVSEGEILGLATGLQSVYLNETPLQNADGSFNFQGATVDFRTGTQTQDYIPGFPDVESEIAVGVELRSATPWVHAVTNLSLSAIRITLGVPALSKADTTNGDIGGYKIDYQIELSKDGGAYAVVLSSSFNGKTTTLYERTARIDLPPATSGWSIRVTRLTANANTASIADTTTVVSYTEVIDAKLRYPMSAVVGVQIDAKQFQSIPTRSYDLYGRIIQVPTNYDPVARTYSGTWDGTFKPAWTSNPAWVFRDLVLNDRYGLGNRITAAQLDKWALYSIAQYCDQMVSNGKGGTEPRFTCNAYIQSQKAAYAVLQDLASVFRGISYWAGGSILASADKPADPVYVYTAANVIGGKFSRVGTSKKTRYTVALVSWNDPSDFYRAKVEYTEDAEGIKRYGIQQVSLTAFGCTSQGQAQRAGKWALTTSRLETDVITFDVGLDGAIAVPGQIIRVADPSRMGRRVGGRVHTASGRVVTLDKAPTINAGDKLTVMLPTGASETRNVVSVAGDAVTVDADWSTLPIAQSVWSVDSSTLVAPTFKVLSVTEKSGGMEFTITATQHEPGKYDFVDNNTTIVSYPQTVLDVSKQAPPASVTLTGNTVSLNDVQKLNLSVTCAAVDGAVAYEGAYKRDSSNWIPLARQPGPTFDVPDVIAGTYIAKLSAINSIGIVSTETVSSPAVLTKTIDSIYNAAARLNNTLIYAYQRSASTPSGTPGSVDYDFVAKTITTATLANGWQKTIPTANGNPLYVTVATASSAGSTDNIGSSEWSGAVVLVQDGPGGTGTNGLNTATAFIYQRNATGTAPALPSATATYNFGASTPLSGLNNGWTSTVPAASGGAFLFVSTATASSVTGSDTISASEWAAAQILGQDGIGGGKNLYPDSGFERGTHPCTERSGAVGTVQLSGGGPLQGLHSLFFDSNGLGDAYLYLGGPKCPVTPGTQYTISFYYCSAGSPASGSSFFRTYNGTTAVDDVRMNNQPLFTSGVWTRFSMQWTCPAGVDSIEMRFGFVCTVYSWMAVDMIQVEEGNRVSAWSPALVDFSADIAVAQAAADSAVAKISVISADGYLSRDEKPGLIQQYQAIYNEVGLLYNAAIGMSLSSEPGAYYSAFAALQTYLGGLSPAYNDSTADTVIDRTAFNTYFNNYYSAKAALQAATDARAAQIAVWASITGANKPQDNATYGAPAGTPVGGVDASTIATQASNGAAAASTLNTPITITGLNDQDIGVTPSVTTNLGTYSGTISNGVGPFKYVWSVEGGSGAVFISGDNKSSSVVLKGRASSGNTFDAYVTLSVVDAQSRTATATFLMRIEA